MKKEMQYNLGLALVTKLRESIFNISQTRSLGDESGTTGIGGDSSKFADLFIEKEIIRFIEEINKTNNSTYIALLTEETGFLEFGQLDEENGIFLILDPLDGSNNIRAFRTPAPSVSISLGIGSLKHLKTNDNFNAIEVAFCIDIFNNRIYSCVKSQRPQVLNFGEIQTSPIDKIEDALIGISFDYQSEKLTKITNRVQSLMESKKCQRRLGSSVLDMCKVASGEYDAFISFGRKMAFYDIAAAKLIIESAGGVFEIVSGNINYCLIKKILKEKDEKLLGEVKYEVVSSANHTLHSKIKTLLN